ncbi:hypothetical protein ABK040_008307 [Willaertia magna]
MEQQEKKNKNPETPCKDKIVIENKRKELKEIYNDYSDIIPCTCCTTEKEYTIKEYLPDNLNNNNLLNNNLLNKNYKCWLSSEDIGKQCIYLKDEIFNKNNEYLNIYNFFKLLEDNYIHIKNDLIKLLKLQEEYNNNNNYQFKSWPESICKTKNKWTVYPLGYAFGRDMTSDLLNFNHHTTMNTTTHNVEQENVQQENNQENNQQEHPCKYTIELLKKINEEYKYVTITTAGFSCLHSNCYIIPHKGYYGYANHCLRVHLGLIVPKENHHQCALRVGNTRITWKEGKIFAFDDYITHEAYNLSNEDRYILLLDIKFNEKEKLKFFKGNEYFNNHLYFNHQENEENSDMNCTDADYTEELKEMLNNL